MAQEPNIEVVQDGPSEGGGPWRMGFRVTNRCAEPVELVQAWLPHPRLRADLLTLHGSSPLATGESTRLTFDVSFDEGPGTEVENTFVILRARWREELWRVLTRMTATAGSDGSPMTRVAAVTAHRVGFSAGP